MVFKKRVEAPAHAADAPVGIHQRGLGSLEDLAGQQQPAEIVVADAHQQAGRPELGDLGVRQEAAAVDQGRTDGLPRLLGGFGAGQGHKRRGLGAAGAPAAGYALVARRQRPSADDPLPAPGPRQCDQLPAVVRQVQAQAQGAGELQRRAAPVDDPGAAGHGGTVVVYGVIQRHHKAGIPVPQGDAQRGAPLAPGSGQALQRGLFVQYFGLLHPQVHGPAAVRALHLQRTVPHVPQPEGRVFLGQPVQGALLHAEAAVRQHVRPSQQVRGVQPLQPRAEVQVGQRAAGHFHQHIADLIVPEMIDVAVAQYLRHDPLPFDAYVYLLPSNSHSKHRRTASVARRASA